MLKMAAPVRPHFWLLIHVFVTVVQSDDANLSPIVLNTWPFTNATEAAWTKLAKQGRALDAVEVGCTTCEVQQCDGTVGYGGSPDDNGETTLDAAIMDGVTHDVGSVGGLRRIKSAISVARAVMTYTKHTLLVGEMATSFAKDMGFKEQDLTTNNSVNIWTSWVKNKCQPNFRQHVVPDSDTSCGPYAPGTHTKHIPRYNEEVRRNNHDTIGMIAIDHLGHIAGGTSTNGANHKVHGRVGDSPIIGAGLYVDQEVGGAAATGDGDVMMRFLPSYQTVEYMRQGLSPKVAARLSIQRIAKYYPQFMGALIAIDIKNRLYGAACHGFKTFPFSVMDGTRPAVSVITVKCT